MDSDTADLNVFWFCLLCLAVGISIPIGQEIERRKPYQCAVNLADGRGLTTTWLGPQGHARCTYVAPAYGSRKYRRG